MTIKRIVLLLNLMLTSSVLADTKCFIMQENDKTLAQEGECSKRYAPWCSFNIAISLMSYNEGILVDETHPEWPFKQGYVDWSEIWKQPHNPTTWMQHSCVWYSQLITQKIGMKKFSNYVKQFDYGNQDVLGDFGKNNGLTNAWLGSSLKISPEEQLVFLQKFLDYKLALSHKAYQMTKNILFVENLPNGWKLYGKTGAGNQRNKDGTISSLWHGWFVGWIEKENKKILFVNHIQDDVVHDTYPSLRAKQETKERLLHLIEDRRQ